MRTNLRHSRGLFTAAPLLAFVFGLLIAPEAGAQTGIAITSPTHGTLVTDTSPFFTPAPVNEVRVRGTVTLVLPKSQWKVFVQGKNVTLTPTAVAGTFSFTSNVWVGWEPPVGGPAPASYPYRTFFTEPHNIHIPLIAELYHKASKTVAARDRIVLIDGRLDGTMNPAFGGTKVDDAAHVQLTSEGLDALQSTHRSTMPHPDTDTFNAELEAAVVAGAVRTIAMKTRARSNDKACVSLSTVPGLFDDTAAYAAVVAEAITHKAAYDAAQAAQQGGAWLPPGWATGLALAVYLEQECVRDVVTPLSYDHFEVCAETLEGEMTDLETSGITATNLSYGPGSLAPTGSKTDDIYADVDMGHLDGTAEGRLRDVFLRYSEAPEICNTRLSPKAGIDQTTLLSDPERADWATCTGLEVDADAAHLGTNATGAFNTDPLTLAVKPGIFSVKATSGSELIDVTGKGGVKFTLDPNQTTNADYDTCTEPAFNQPALDLLDRFYPDIKQAIQTAWNRYVPQTQQTVALDKLLEPLEVGTYEPFDHTVLFQVDELDAHAPTPGVGYDGLTASFKTNADLIGTYEVTPPSTTWMYSEPGESLFGTAFAPGIFSENGVSRFNQPFDFAFGITTGFLNQVLRERSAAEWMRFNYTPMVGESGVPNTGLNPTDPLPLDAVTLTNLHAAFATLGTANFTISVYPTMQPFTWVPPDPVVIPPAPPIQLGEAPLTYQLGQLLVDFLSDDPSNPMPLRIAIDFYDEWFNFDLSSDADLLVPELDNPLWILTILQSSIPGCPKTPHSINAIVGLNPCERSLETALMGFLVPELEERMLGMLSDVPAPITFDVTGMTSGRKFEREDTYIQSQRIVFYGQLEPPF